MQMERMRWLRRCTLQWQANGTLAMNLKMLYGFAQRFRFILHGPPEHRLMKSNGLEALLAGARAKARLYEACGSASCPFATAHVRRKLGSGGSSEIELCAARVRGPRPLEA